MIAYGWSFPPKKKKTIRGFIPEYMIAHGQSMSLEFPRNEKQMEASADMILIFIMFCPCVD